MTLLEAERMKLIMTLLIRDEIDIISSNIEFHLNNGVDFVIATDNRSVDGTTDILRDYERRGVLHYIYEAQDNYAQHRWVTRMARLAATQFGADWVINSDADEFWWPEHHDLKQILHSMPPHRDAVGAERLNFPPWPIVGGQFFADVMTVRERQSLSLLGQPLLGKTCHRAFTDIEVEQGNHIVRRHGRPLAAAPGSITILHFPMRSYHQFANKIVNGGSAYKRNANLPSEVGKTWRYLYELWERGELEAYYQAQTVNDAAVEEGLRQGRLVTDVRLQNFFSRHPDRQRPR